MVFQAPQASPSPPPPPPSSPSHRYSPLAKAADDDNHTVTPIAHGKGEHLRVTFPIRQTPAESAVKHQRRPSYNELESRNSRETFATGNGSSRLSWRQGEVVGTGTFGKVYRGLNTKTGELLAIKQVCLAEGTEEEVDMLRKEITLMHSLRHPHIVRYIGTDISDRYLYIILEYVPGGSIASLLATFGPFSEDLMRKFTYQILLGVKYLHERGIMHRDIKGTLLGGVVEDRWIGFSQFDTKRLCRCKRAGDRPRNRQAGRLWLLEATARHVHGFAGRIAAKHPWLCSVDGAGRFVVSTICE